MHLLASARFNGFHRSVHLFSVCASDTTTPCELSGHRDNQGALKHVTSALATSLPGAFGASALSARERPLGWRRGTTTTMAVRIDDVLSPRVRRTFLKVDIEGRCVPLCALSVCIVPSRAGGVEMLGGWGGIGEGEAAKGQY